MDGRPAAWSPQVVDDVPHLLREMPDIFRHARIRQRRRRDLVAARRSPDAQVDPVGIERVQYPKRLPPPSVRCSAGNMTPPEPTRILLVCAAICPHHHFGRRARKVRQVVVLRYPVPLVSPASLWPFASSMVSRSAVPALLPSRIGDWSTTLSCNFSLKSFPLTPGQSAALGPSSDHRI